MGKRLGFVLSSALVLSLSPTLVAQSPSRGGEVEELIRQEDLRASFERALELSERPARSGAVKIDNLVNAVEQLVAVGPDVVPHVVRELELTLPDTFYFAAYALGRLGTNEAEAALRRAITATQRETTDFAAARKAWACHALGLMGRADAVELLNAGPHQSAGTTIHGGMSAIEAVAVQTAPDCVPRLTKQFDDYDEENDPYFAQRILIVKALGRTSAPEALPRLVDVLRNEHAALRRHATLAVGRIATREAVGALLDALDDEDVRVRQGAALGLEDAVPTGQLERPLAKLESEKDPILRGALYRVVARAGGTGVLDTLTGHWGRPDPSDRAQLARAIGSLATPAAIPLLRRAMLDRDNQVAVAAAWALSRIGTREARDVLIENVSSPIWARAQAAIDELVPLGETRAAAPIAERLIEVEMAVVVGDPHRRWRAQRLAQALVELRQPLRLDELAAARERQTDPILRETLDRRVEQLALIRRLGQKTKRWIEVASHADADTRRLAYPALGAAGDERAASALVEAFGRVEPEEGAEVLRALGATDTAAGRQLLERVLLGEAFDAPDRAGLRDAAAWSARRIGGPAMVDLLDKAVERRQARDVKPLIYLAVLAGEAALPTVERWHLRRMHFLKYSRGVEFDKLAWMARELRAGRSIDELDLPPEALDMR